MDTEQAKQFFARYFNVPAGHTVYVTNVSDKRGCGKLFDVFSVRYGMGPRGPLRSHVVLDKQDAVHLVIDLEDYDPSKHEHEYAPPPSRLEGVSRILAAEGVLPPRGGADDPAITPTFLMLMPVPGELCTPELFKRRSPHIMKHQSDNWRSKSGESFGDFFHRVCNDAWVSVEGDTWTMGFYVMNGSEFAAWSIGGTGPTIIRASRRVVQTESSAQPLGPAPG